MAKSTSMVKAKKKPKQDKKGKAKSLTVAEAAERKTTSTPSS
jgi:hypothetical protein